MEKMQMVEKLREHADITMEEAREILEKNSWDLLDACVELEKRGKMNGAAQASTEYANTQTYEEVSPTVTGKSYEGGAAEKSERPARKFKEAVRGLFRMSLDNKFVVKRKEDVLIRVPVLVPLICLMAKFWITLLVLFVGLVIGLKYFFEGKELGTDEINSTIEKATERAAEAANGIFK